MEERDPKRPPPTERDEEAINRFRRALEAAEEYGGDGDDQC